MVVDRKFVRNEEQIELIGTENKYGTLIKTYETATYSIFSDGSKEKGLTYERTEKTSI